MNAVFKTGSWNLFVTFDPIVEYDGNKVIFRITKEEAESVYHRIGNLRTSNKKPKAKKRLQVNCKSS